MNGTSAENILAEIMGEITPVFGVCSFADVAKYTLPCRAARRLPENAKSVIVALFPYYLGERAYENSDLSRYAVVPDYNECVLQMLKAAALKMCGAFPGERFEAFCGSSPLPEVFVAQRAGLGQRGKNGLLLTEKYGSWVFIGEIVSSVVFSAAQREMSYCISCNKCIDACPTGALSSEGFDITRCLSAISQQKSELSPEQSELIKSSGCVWGCDRCQRACPVNDGAQVTEIGEFIRGARARASLEALEGRAYAWRGKKVIQRNLELIYGKDGCKNETDSGDN